MCGARTYSDRMSLSHMPEPTRKLMTKAVRHDLRSLRKVVFAIEKTSGPPRVESVVGRLGVATLGAVNGRSGKRIIPANLRTPRCAKPKLRWCR